MTLHIDFDNSYARLPEALFTRMPPTPVAAPRLLALNEGLAEDLGLDAAALRGPDGLALLSGNEVPEGAAPLAQAYGGHQFGQWNPGLGDGRALLIGEVVGRDGQRRDIQLKGSGPTPYSRNGDGRSWLGPVLREYIVSEAMHALGVPTTRALAAVTTGEEVYRDTPLPGAVLTRVARSHIRVGTFQVHAARGQIDELQALLDHAIARHHPQADGPAAFLAAVTAAQARLVAQWMGLGFIHGVMNTDNSSVAGETIDYGPCAFMDGYAPDRVFSSIDQFGRYAYGNQPNIAAWNMAQLATALLPLMPDREAAIADFTAIVNGFADTFQPAWIATFGAKIGLADPGPADVALIQDLLALMAERGADFTLTFTALTEDRDPGLGTGFADWQSRWQARRGADWQATMARVNPAVIPRNHKVEEVIAAGVAGDFAPFHAMLAAVTAPFVPDADFAAAPSPDEAVTRTFCGT